MRDVYKPKDEEFHTIEEALSKLEDGPVRYKVGCDMVLVEMFPELDKIGEVVIPGKRQFMKAVKGKIRSVGTDVKDYKVGDVAVVAPGNGGLLRDGLRSYRAMPQQLIIAIDLKLTDVTWSEAVEAHKADMKEKFNRHDGDKLESEKI